MCLVVALNSEQSQGLLVPGWVLPVLFHTFLIANAENNMQSFALQNVLLICCGCPDISVYVFHENALSFGL